MFLVIQSKKMLKKSEKKWEETTVMQIFNYLRRRVRYDNLVLTC